MSDTTSAPTTAPVAAPVSPTATPAAPTSAPASPAPAAPAAPVSPLRAALSQLPQNATWADAGSVIKSATQANAPAPAAPAAPTDPGGQPRDAQGRFASPDTDPNAAPLDSQGAAPVSGEDGDAAAPEGEEAPPDGEQAPEPITVMLKGRNGEEIPFAVESEADADVLRALKNDGLRGEEYKRKSADLERGFSELRDIGAHMKADPEGFMISQLTPERQLSVARVLLVNNLEALAPDIQLLMNDPIARRQAMLDIREASSAKAADVNNLIAGYRAAAEAERAIAGLIPDSASEEDANAFFGDATALLTGQAQQGRAVAPQDIPAVLSRLIAAYGFGANGTAAAPAASTAKNATPPAPAPDADPLAERKAKVAAVVRRTSQVAAQRQAAARVAPQGAGAAAVEAPKLPKGQDISQRTASLKERFRPGMGWTEFLGRR